MMLSRGVHTAFLILVINHNIISIDRALISGYLAGIPITFGGTAIFNIQVKRDW